MAGMNERRMEKLQGKYDAGAKDRPSARSVLCHNIPDSAKEKRPACASLHDITIHITAFRP
jgi:hypothetical protein